MTHLTIYEPNSITMPRELVEQHINVLVATVATRAIRWIDIGYQPSINNKYALIHDVFRTRDGTKIIALDSAWHTRRHKMLHAANHHELDEYKAGHFEIGRNKMTALSTGLSQLLHELWPLKVYHCGKPLNYQYRRLAYARLRQATVGIYEISLSSDLQSKSIIELDFVFGNGSLTHTLQIPPNPFVALEKTPLVLHTLQKDNALEWIEDWCKYYYRECGVKRIVIYDNDSANRNALAQCLKRIEDPLDLILINWPFNYSMSFNNTQDVALNHALHILGDSSQYYLNFDIDEYLINPNDLSLEQYLNNHDDGQKVHHRLFQRVVSATKTNGLPCVSDFLYVQKHCLRYSPKTINIQGRVEYVGVHFTIGNPHFALRVLHRMCVILLEQFHPSFFSSNIFNHVIVKMDTLLSPVSLWTRWRHRHTPPKQHKPLYFNHYRGLNTNWKKYGIRVIPIDKLREDYVLDTVMIKKLQAIGLASEEQKDMID